MTRSILAIGLQKTGKTTFLAAFWDVVAFANVQGSLQLERTSGDMDYLNEIHTAWADCAPITRTGPASDRPVTMRLVDSVSSLAMELAWTDMLGETFERQWTERVWSRGYQQLARRAAGVLLFVHPKRVNESPLIIDAQEMAKRIKARSNASSRSRGKSNPMPIPFEARGAPTQVQLIDLLQFLDSERRDGERLGLAVIVSAWDLVERTEQVSPQVWLERRMPLLHQFLWTNGERFSSRVFGVSAQGGDYAEAAALRRFVRASDRVNVVSANSTSHDITAPVRWAMDPSGD